MRLCLCVLSLLFGLWTVAGAEAPPAVIVVLLPGTSLRDWETSNAPHLHQLMQTGAVAVMNTRTARLPNDHTRESPDSALRTLGAGARATALPSQSVGYDLRFGNLADTLAAHGCAVEAGGGPAAALVAADGAGHVSLVTSLTARPNVCLIWDAGDDIVRADALIGNAARQVSRLGGRLLVLSPYADDRDYRTGHRLTPLLEWGPGISAGLLSSPSTRRAGLVTNTDFAPSVASAFGIPREDFRTLPFGQAWNSKPSAQAVSAAETIERQAVQQMSGMRLLPFLAAVLAGWIAVCTWMVFRGQTFTLGGLLPITTLSAALYSISAVSFGLAGGVMLAAAWLGARRFGVSSVVTALAALCLLSLILDMLTGSRWMHQSLLGYSAIEGARYYGLGNEAMGMMLGTALVLAARFWPYVLNERWIGGRNGGRAVGICLLASLSLLLGTLGAKAGGLLVSVAMFGVFVYRADGGRWSRRTVLVGSVFIAGVMAVLALAEAFLLPHSSSHIGGAVQRIGAGGPGEALDIIRRKLAVEGHLAYHSAWALLLWGGLGSLAALWKRSSPPAPTTQAFRQAGLVGIGACLLLNDAGVVAAALFVSLLWSYEATAIKNTPASV